MDTGSTAELTLTPEAIRALGLRPLRTSPATLADDSVIESTVDAVRAMWPGELRTIEAMELDTDALLGMRLLADSRVTFDVIDGGRVELRKLPVDDA